jgi:hypothetical protein
MPPAAIVLLLLAGLLAACGDTTQPFSKANIAPARPPPAIQVSEMTGLPSAQSSAMFDALVSAAAVRGIGVGRGQAEAGYALAGEFEDTGTAVQYRWTLTDSRGRILHRIEETESARAPSERLPELDGIPVDRIAAYTAESLSSRLSQLGFATRAAGMPPPLDHLVEAGPGAEQEIDYETLHGPGRSEAAVSLTGEEPEMAVADTEGAIQGVAITGVKGAGEAGNGELAGALARVLTDAGWPVQEGSRDNTLMIEGDVRLEKPNGKAQTVTLRWTVKAPDGQILGAVEQANDVPAGSLDNGWGEAANHAALAAAQGIFDLVDKLR